MICNKLGHLTKGCRNKVEQSNLKERMSAKADINKVDYFVDGVLKMNIWLFVFKFKLIKNPKQWWVNSGEQNMYTLRRGCSLLTKKLMVDTCIWIIK